MLLDYHYHHHIHTRVGSTQRAPCLVAPRPLLAPPFPTNRVFSFCCLRCFTHGKPVGLGALAQHATQIACKPSPREPLRMSRQRIGRSFRPHLSSQALPQLQDDCIAAGHKARRETYTAQHPPNPASNASARRKRSLQRAREHVGLQEGRVRYRLRKQGDVPGYVTRFHRPCFRCGHPSAGTGRATFYDQEVTSDHMRTSTTV
jgi:hypothetical protein